MLMPHKPMSNAERQREFLRRHPGYYQRYTARRRAVAKAAREMLPALLAPMPAEAEAVAQKRRLLMLPAPVETIQIPGMNTIEAIPIAQ